MNPLDGATPHDAVVSGHQMRSRPFIGAKGTPPVLPPDTPVTSLRYQRLYVNIDHVATVRQARRGTEPDPVAAATLCERAGADGITAHLREDRRHIHDADIQQLAATVTTTEPTWAAASGRSRQNCRKSP